MPHAFAMAAATAAVAAPPAATPPYQVTIQTISGIGDDIALRSLLDRQQFHDPLGEAEREGISSSAWPLFGMLWPSARVLADAMLRQSFAGKRILEVGCGLALSALVVHRRGGDITASDCHPLTAAFLHENLLLNQLPPMKYQTGNWSRANLLLGRFDLIIGSDVLYDRDQPAILSRFIALHAQANVEVVIVDPDRGNRSSFNRAMDAMGYSRTEERVSSLPGDSARYKGRVLRYLKTACA